MTGQHEVGRAPVGVLALQGGFEAHRRVLKSLGARVKEVRVPADLDGLVGLVMPGGESTTMTLGVQREGLAEPLTQFVRSGMPVLATCAGAIMLDGAHLALLDIDCDRNAYGGQVHSFEADIQVDGLPNTATALTNTPFRGVFIRAPRFTRVGDEVATIARLDDQAVAVRAGNIVALAFHPELTSDDRIHRLFLEQISIKNVTNLDQWRAA